MADAHPHPPVIRTDMSAQTLDTVVTGTAAAELQPQLAGRKIEFVIENEQFGRFDFEVAQNGAECAPGFVHKCGRFEKHDTGITDTAFGYISGQAVAAAKAFKAIAASNLIGDQIADIVSVFGISSARISEPGKNIHNILRRPYADWTPRV